MGAVRRLGAAVLDPVDEQHEHPAQHRLLLLGPRLERGDPVRHHRIRDRNGRGRGRRDRGRLAFIRGFGERRVAAIEARIEEQEVVIRRVLTLLVEWVEKDEPDYRTNAA